MSNYLSSKKIKILHITDYFSEDMSYQENLLARGQHENGNDVYIITSNIEYQFQHNFSNRKRNKGHSLYYGVNIIRLGYYFEIKNRFVFLKNLLENILEIQPDIIFHYDHSPSLFSCISYIKRNRDCKLNILFHSTKENSMNSLFGKPYHQIFWKTIIKRIQKYYNKVMCNSPEALAFAKNIYEIKKDKLKILPLPGISNYTNNYFENRILFRKKYGFEDNSFVIVHTGKLPGKKNTKLLLDSFTLLKGKEFRLIIIGSITKDFENIFNKYLEKDYRINFVGWKTAKQIRELYVAGDLMIQPGSLSNTFIDAICNGLPILLKDTEQGSYLVKQKNGELLVELTEDEMINFIIKIKNNIDFYRNNALKYSKYFDYKNNALQSLLE